MYRLPQILLHPFLFPSTCNVLEVKSFHCIQVNRRVTSLCRSQILENLLRQLGGGILLQRMSLSMSIKFSPWTLFDLVLHSQLLTIPIVIIPSLCQEFCNLKIREHSSSFIYSVYLLPRRRIWANYDMVWCILLMRTTGLESGGEVSNSRWVFLWIGLLFQHRRCCQPNLPDNDLPLRRWSLRLVSATHFCGTGHLRNNLPGYG